MEPQIIVKPTQQPKWTSLIPNILRSRHLRCISQTPESAKILHERYGFFANGRELTHEVEQHLFDAFCEDDYDGLLHLTTIHEMVAHSAHPVHPTYIVNETSMIGKQSSDIIEDLGVPIGIVFWREVLGDEMEEWMNFDKIAKCISEDSLIDNDNNNTDSDSDSDNRKSITIDKEENLGKSLELVRQSSISSIRSIPSIIKAARELNGGKKLQRGSMKSLHDQISHAWIKIELLAVRKEQWGQKIGSLLLACALYHAHLQKQSRAILHVAGGETNVPAVRLYRRFGFLPISKCTFFHRPDRDLYVLGDIGKSLEDLAWGKTLRN